MTMSKDRVRFRLPRRYFQGCHQKRPNGFNRHTMMVVLRKAFGMTDDESANLMDSHPGGFEIECRPSQFARFIVLRHETNEGINGIKDLEPRMVQPTEPKDVYQWVAERLSLHPAMVKNVVRCFYDYTAVHFRSSTKPVYPKIIDVSQRPAW